MGTPTRFPNGINNANKSSTLSNYVGNDPTKMFQYFNDFTNYTAGDWTITRVGTTPTEGLVANEPGGAIVLTMAATDNSADQLQHAIENFTMVTGKKAWFKTRFKVSDATQSDWLMGLAVLDTTLLDTTNGGADGVTDGIFFYKNDGDALINFSCQKDATTGQLTQANIGTCTTSYMTLGWEYDGVRTISVYKDDVKVYSMDLSATPSTYLPDTEITVSMAMANGEAVSKTMTIDYVFAAIDR
jgi:hypothetical protein